MVIGEIIRQNPIVRYIYEKLSLIVLIKAYYLHQEVLHEEGTLDLQLRLDDCTVGFLTPTEIKGLLANPEVPQSEDILLERLASGCQCFGLKHGGEIVAYTWCNLRNCDHRSLSFPLKEDEAYLFDMRTFKPYRGKNLAPYLRYHLYKHLEQMGRTKFFSLTVALNTSSLNFKKKLKAKPLEFYLYINLFQRFSWRIPLKRYNVRMIDEK